MIYLGKILKLQALKFPNIPHYEWEGELVQATSDYVLVYCKPNRKLKHYTKNDVFTIKNRSFEFFSLKEWFTAALEVDKGQLISAYCNVAKPAIFEKDTISFVDLDLDYIMDQHSGWKVVDEEEFEENSIKYKYPEALKKEDTLALDRLKEKVAKNKFPFNEEIITILEKHSYV